MYKIKTNNAMNVSLENHYVVRKILQSLKSVKLAIIRIIQKMALFVNPAQLIAVLAHQLHIVNHV